MRASRELGAYLYFSKRTLDDIKSDCMPVLTTELIAVEHYAEYLRLMDKVRAEQIEYNMKQILKQANEHAKKLKGDLQ